MHRAYLLLPLALVLACHDDHEHWGHSHRDGPSILFSLRQSKDPTTGAVTSSSIYEFVELRGDEWSQQKSTEDDECYFEDVSTRVGRQRVEGGIARFQGGSLPADGLVLLGNQEVAEYEGPAFTTGQVLRLSVDGFALPRIDDIRIAAPASDITVLAPAAAPLTLKRGADVDVSWTVPAEAPRSTSIAIAFGRGDAQTRGPEVVCFFKRTTAARVPGPLLARLAPNGGSASGTVDIFSHAQSSVAARGGWTIYGVVSALHYRQPFTLSD